MSDCYPITNVVLSHVPLLTQILVEREDATLVSQYTEVSRDDDLHRPVLLVAKLAKQPDASLDRAVAVKAIRDDASREDDGITATEITQIRSSGAREELSTTSESVVVFVAVTTSSTSSRTPLGSL